MELESGQTYTVIYAMIDPCFIQYYFMTGAFVPVPPLTILNSSSHVLQTLIVQSDDFMFNFLGKKDTF